MSDDKALKLIHGYPFSKSGGEFFPDFSQNKHVASVPYIPGLPVHQTWDFNVVPYMTCLLSQIQFIWRYISPDGKTKADVPQMGWTGIEVMQIRFYKEYCFESPRNTTQAVCLQFIDDHPDMPEVFYYGDATGAARKPGLGGYTDYGAIEDFLLSYMHNASRRVQVPNMGCLARRDLVNNIMGNRIKEIEILIDQSLELTIKDFEKVKLGVDGKVKSTKKDEETGGNYQVLGHTSDAAEYEICWLGKEYIKY